MKNKVPDRWEAYKAMGRQIPGTRFICFKVPLREPIVQNAVQRGAEWFCPRTLMDHCHNLGLIVDLTFTDRFYDPTVFTSQGIKYAKLRTQGKVVPKQKVVKQFFKIVNGFLEGNKENEKLIGVHCTHGLNRTGYLVCRYMIQHLGIPADQAISDFNSARGHEQERDEYLVHLRQMKWQNEPEVNSDSEKEEAAGNRAPQHKTPTYDDNRRRSKRNYDTFRSRPVDGQRAFKPEWKQHEGNRDGHYRPRAQPEGPVALGAWAQIDRGGGGARPKSGFGGAYDSGALVTKMTMMSLGPQGQSGSGLELPAQNVLKDQNTGTQAEVAPPHRPTTTGGLQRERSTRSTAPPHMKGDTTTTTTTGDEWLHNTIPTSTSNRDRGWGRTGNRRGGRGMSAGETTPTRGRGNTRARGNTRGRGTTGGRNNVGIPHRGRGRPWTSHTPQPLTKTPVDLDRTLSAQDP